MTRAVSFRVRSSRFVVGEPHSGHSLLHRVCAQAFQSVEQGAKHGWIYEFECSFLEVTVTGPQAQSLTFAWLCVCVTKQIYRDDVYDLLTAGERRALPVRQTRTVC